MISLETLQNRKKMPVGSARASPVLKPPSHSIRVPSSRRLWTICILLILFTFLFALVANPLKPFSSPRPAFESPEVVGGELANATRQEWSKGEEHAADTERQNLVTTDQTASGASPLGMACPLPQKRLKVFVYELPRKLNFGFFGSNGGNTTSASMDWAYTDVDNKPWGTLEGEKDAVPPPWPWSGRNRPTAKQHSMEYYIVADLLLPPSMRNPHTVAVRVLDPEQADVFLVPVFSSLMVNVLRRRHFTIHEGLAQDLAQYLSNSTWWKRHSGRDHIVPVHHPCALETLRDWMSGAMFLVVDFARFHPATANPIKDIVHPYNQLISQYPETEELRRAEEMGTSPFKARPTLVYFQGSVTGRPARRAIVDALQGEADVHVKDMKASLASINETEAGMRASKFCLHIVGDTPSASRLFSAIVSGCVPVAISDALDLPFESTINYAHFTLFFSEKVALEKGRVLTKLRAVTEEQWMLMWKELRKVLHHFLYQVPSLPGDAVDMMWREVQERMSWVRLSENRDKRLTIPDWWDHEDSADKVLLRRQANRKRRVPPAVNTSRAAAAAADIKGKKPRGGRGKRQRSVTVSQS